ncbi:hypothetical protein D3C75_1282720 [compost metagenome]
MALNVLSRLPEYEYLKNREPYLSESDGRLHVDVYPLEYVEGNRGTKEWGIWVRKRSGCMRIG